MESAVVVYFRPYLFSFGRYYKYYTSTCKLMTSFWASYNVITELNLVARGGGTARTGCAVAQGETSVALHLSCSEPMTPRDRVLLSECCFISPNFSLLFRIITNKKSRPVRWKRGLVAAACPHSAAQCDPAVPKGG